MGLGEVWGDMGVPGWRTHRMDLSQLQGEGAPLCGSLGPRSTKETPGLLTRHRGVWDTVGGPPWPGSHWGPEGNTSSGQKKGGSAVAVGSQAHPLNP